ncbi:tyrosine-type recombinase/integrase [Allopusillimonas ginsengisoli]|uniref:tyrosine-type recombinase/integrase n=1 Tax=Allopusillimonas ginsengisoli TaxID=453575 RepID=UPI0039C11900
MSDQRIARMKRACPTLTEALQRYVAEVSIKKKSFPSEKSVARIWLSSRFASKSLARITPMDLQEIRDEWLQEVKPSTVVRRLAMISHLYTTAHKDWGMFWLDKNPVSSIRRPSVDDGRDRRLYQRIRLYGVPAEECPPTEFEWLCRATKSVELPVIALIAIETGMRRSEVAMLERERINLTNGVVRLDKTKNGKVRYVPLTPFAEDALRVWIAMRGKVVRGRIFTIQPGSLSKAFSRARKKARKEYEALCKKYGRRPHPAYFTDLRFHDLRHEATSRLGAVFSPQKLASITGQTLEIMVRYYHPKGVDLARELALSPLGKRQREELRQRKLALA